MRRRAMLATAATGGLVGLGGCVLRPPRDDHRHPLAGATVSVGIVDESRSPHDLAAITDASLAFWAAHAPEYAGFSVAFDRVEVGPELVIRFVDDPDHCRSVPSWSELVLGCAPILRPGHRRPELITAYVVGGDRPSGSIRVTTTHEIGHILGLYHHDDPLEIMSILPEHRIPQYQLRVDIWLALAHSVSLSSDASRRFEEGVIHWRDAEDALAEQAFRDAGAGYAAAGEAVRHAEADLVRFTGELSLEMVDLETLRRSFDRLIGRADAMHEAAARMADAAAARDAGDLAAADANRREASDAYARYVDLGPTRLRDVAVALGLVRETDRDEPVLAPAQPPVDSD